MNGLFVGRFQPFHLGHLDAIRFALSRVDNLWIIVGSSNKTNEEKNPFSADERKEMILFSLDDSIAQKIKIFFIPDFDNHKKWAEYIDLSVPKFDVVFSNDEITKHVYEKRGIKVIQVPFTNRDELSGTNIRNRIKSDQKWEHLVPNGAKKVLMKIDAKSRLKIL
jgi:nicotinamide-nucleotide adenylyltransferase